MSTTYTKGHEQTPPDADSCPPATPKNTFLEPWTEDTDAEGWEYAGSSDGQRRGPPLARVIVDLDAEQTAWAGQESDRAGLTIVDFVKRLIDEARTSATQAAR